MDMFFQLSQQQQKKKKEEKRRKEKKKKEKQDPLMYHSSTQTFTKGLVIVNLFERTMLLMYYRQ